MPTPIAVYVVHSATTDTTALTTASFTPSNGELITVELTTWDTANPNGAVSGGGQTWANKITVAPGGFNGYARIDYCTVSGSPGSMTVSSAGTATNSRHSMTVTRWPVGCTLGAVNSTVSGSGAPSANITTTAANSAVTWCSVDVASQDPATAAPRLSATQDSVMDGHVGANSVQYFYRVNDVGAAGTYAMGMTAPGSQTWVLAGAEVIAAASTVSGTATGTVGGLTGTATGTRTVTATANGTAGGISGTGVGVREVTAAAAGTVGGLTGTANGLRTVLGTAVATVGGISGQAVGLRTVNGTGTGQIGGITGAGVVAGPAVDSNAAAVGAPLTSWIAGAPRTSWTTGRPEPSWQAGVPSA